MKASDVVITVILKSALTSVYAKMKMFYLHNSQST